MLRRGLAVVHRELGVLRQDGVHKTRAAGSNKQRLVDEELMDDEIATEGWNGEPVSSLVRLLRARTDRSVAARVEWKTLEADLRTLSAPDRIKPSLRARCRTRVRSWRHAEQRSQRAGVRRRTNAGGSDGPEALAQRSSAAAPSRRLLEGESAAGQRPEAHRDQGSDEAAPAGGVPGGEGAKEGRARSKQSWRTNVVDIKDNPIVGSGDGAR